MSREASPEKAPPLLIVLACVIVIGVSFWLASDGLGVWLFLLQLGVAILLSGLLLRRGRVAWLLLLIGAIWTTVASVLDAGASWGQIANVTLMFCLLMPSSVRYVWYHERSSSTTPSSGDRDDSSRLTGWVYTGMAKVALWESAAEQTERSYTLLIWRLGVAIVLLLMGIGVIGAWQEDAGGDSVVLAVLSDVAWTIYFIVQLSFIGAVGLAIRERLFRKRRRPV